MMLETESHHLNGHRHLLDYFYCTEIPDRRQRSALPFFPFTRHAAHPTRVPGTDQDDSE